MNLSLCLKRLEKFKKYRQVNLSLSEPVEEMGVSRVYIRGIWKIQGDN